MILHGAAAPIGATVYPDGVNFSIFSGNAERIELLLFDEPDSPQPSRVIALNKEENRSFYYWHCFVAGIGHGQVYAYRVYGPFDPLRGLRFQPGKVLLDPYAKAIVGRNYDRDAAKRTGDNCATALRSVVVDPTTYNWEGDKPLNYPLHRAVIYELHVGGFTKNPNSGVQAELRGTYLGLIEKIPYLKELGITSVELLPIQQFDPFDAFDGLTNFWGYSPVGFFAPHSGYASGQHPTAALDEFRDMVKALHRAGIEVILDVVFNHTAEHGVEGPTLSFKGIANESYYLLGPTLDKYRNFSGTGNTINANHSVVRRTIRECLRYWVEHLHVDGFRFDLAAILSRGESGDRLENPPLLWELESDPVLARTKLIAEAWDIESYQLGTFTGDKWAEWNGRFRDDVRRFMRSDLGMTQALANRMLGSPDIFPNPQRQASRSINFITCHDGFTLNDLVSYNYKHNEANGEGNRDGTNENYSWNCGEEGPSANPEVEALRLRQIKNLITLLLCANGTPMLLMGDEVRRTQNGNNNAYCQDNETGWFDWSLVEKNQNLLKFTRELIQLIRGIGLFNRDQLIFHDPDGPVRVTWHGTRLHHPDFSPASRHLAYTLSNFESREYLHIMVNGDIVPCTFDVPDFPYDTVHEKLLPWRLIVNTEAECHAINKAPVVDLRKFPLSDHAVAVLYTSENWKL